MEQCRIKVLKEHLALNALEQYEQLLIKLLGKYGYSLKQNGVLHQETILSRWDSYTSEHFAATTEFTVETMNRYMYLIFQCQGAEVIMDDMVSRLENVKEILRVSKFRIQYIADLPAASMDCFIINYQNYKKYRRKNRYLTA